MLSSAHTGPAGTASRLAGRRPGVATGMIRETIQGAELGRATQGLRPRLSPCPAQPDADHRGGGGLPDAAVPRVARRRPEHRHRLLGGGGGTGTDRRGRAGLRDQRGTHRRPHPAPDRGHLGGPGDGAGRAAGDPRPPHPLVHDRRLHPGGGGDLLRAGGDRRARLRLRRRHHQYRHRAADRRPGHRPGLLHSRAQPPDRRLRPDRLRLHLPYRDRDELCHPDGTGGHWRERQS